METRELTCIGCPMGCTLHVEMDNGSVLLVSGNTCPKGDVYARKEVTNPTRIVTTTVPVIGSETETMISVKTEYDIPKDKIFDCMRALKNLNVQAPVHIGDVIVQNVANTGVNVIATKDA